MIYCIICGQWIIKKLFSNDYPNINLFVVFFLTDFARWESVEVVPQSLTLKALIREKESQIQEYKSNIK